MASVEKLRGLLSVNSEATCRLSGQQYNQTKNRAHSLYTCLETNTIHLYHQDDHYMFYPPDWGIFIMRIYFKMYSFIYSQQWLITIIITIIQVPCICAWNEVESISNIYLVQLLQIVRLSQISQYSDIVYMYLQESSILCRTAGHYHMFMERRVHHSIIKQITCPLWQRIVNEAY